MQKQAGKPPVKSATKTPTVSPPSTPIQLIQARRTKSVEFLAQAEAAYTQAQTVQVQAAQNIRHWEDELVGIRSVIHNLDVLLDEITTGGS